MWRRNFLEDHNWRSQSRGFLGRGDASPHFLETCALLGICLRSMENPLPERKPAEVGWFPWDNPALFSQESRSDFPLRE
jgi:hypothetical protein